MIIIEIEADYFNTVSYARLSYNWSLCEPREDSKLIDVAHNYKEYNQNSVEQNRWI